MVLMDRKSLTSFSHLQSKLKVHTFKICFMSGRVLARALYIHPAALLQALYLRRSTSKALTEDMII